MNLFLLGAVAACSVIAALFFLRFWRRTRDGLFLAFAAAFTLEGLSRIALAASPNPSEGEPAIFLLRLAAYAIIIVGIVLKNWAR